ncbi:putative quinol monooxygenase [Streptomyces sp. JW3]|uniref:putative quinol monooxygenase n=1 Tax=Streptomyces sp. JW3 TaxID=3456955 RepID=UPI003FA472F0
MIIVHGGVSVVSDRVDEVGAAGAAFQKSCLAEEGCVEYQLSWQLDQPANLRLLEVWTSREAHNAHKARSHTAEWTRFIGGVAAAAPEFTEYAFGTD